MAKDVQTMTISPGKTLLDMHDAAVVRISCVEATFLVQNGDVVASSGVLNIVGPLFASV